MHKMIDHRYPDAVRTLGICLCTVSLVNFFFGDWCTKGGWKWNFHYDGHQRTSTQGGGGEKKTCNHHLFIHTPASTSFSAMELKWTSTEVP